MISTSYLLWFLFFLTFLITGLSLGLGSFYLPFSGLWLVIVGSLGCFFTLVTAFKTKKITVQTSKAHLFLYLVLIVACAFWTILFYFFGWFLASTLSLLFLYTMQGRENLKKHALIAFLFIGILGSSLYLLIRHLPQGLSW